MRSRLAMVLLLGVALAAPAHAGAATISGAGGDVWNAADPAPTYTITATRGSRVEWRLEGRGGGWTRGASPLVVALHPIADGLHTLLARDRRGGDDDDEDDVARRSFRVDTLAPGIEIREPRAGAAYGQGQAVAVGYSCTGAVSCAGPVADGQALPTDRAGPASFAVHATDDAGNASTAAVDYTVAPPPVPLVGPAAPVAQAPVPAPVILRRSPARRPAAGAVRLVRNHRLMSPAAATRLTTQRPVLRWRPRAGARVYNVQVFEVRGPALRKVLSAFPAGAGLRVPAGTLSGGRRYSWRVWPYLRGGYPSRPIGVSFFDVGSG